MSGQTYLSEKYIDRQVGVWIIFGEHQDGTVDVHCNGTDIFCGLPREVADKVEDLQEEFRQKLYKLLGAK